MAALLAAAEAQAVADFGIEPLRLELSKARKNGSLRLRNNGDAPVLVQVDAVTWVQREGRDVLEATKDLVVSPPLFRLAAKGGQTIRVGHAGKPDATREITYRILIREVAEKQPEQTGVSAVLQLSLPIFVAADKPGKPDMAWRLSRSPDGKLRLNVENRGTSHAQIAEVKLDPPLLSANAAPAGYVLHGQSRFWEWESKEALPAGVKATFRLNGQPAEAVIQVGN